MGLLRKRWRISAAASEAEVLEVVEARRRKTRDMALFLVCIWTTYIS